MLITDGINITDLPEECVMDCSGPGPADQAVRYWSAKLDFAVDRDAAIRCLREYGARSREQLDAMSDTDLADKILWLACGDFREFLTYTARGYLPEDVPAGTDYFYLGV